MAARRIVLTIVFGVMFASAGCDLVVPTTVKTKPSPRRPSPSPEPSVESTESPAPAASTAAVASPKTSPVPSEGPRLEGSPPPIAFPYKQIGQQWIYDAKVKVGFPLTVGITMNVIGITAEGARLRSTTLMSSKATSTDSDIKGNTTNPYSPASLGFSFSEGGETKSTINKVTIETVTVPGGTFETLKYEIVEEAAGNTVKILLWVGKDEGVGMVKMSLDSPKPPNLANLAGNAQAAAFLKGPTTITMELKKKETGVILDPGATTPVASTAPVASAPPPFTGAPNPILTALYTVGRKWEYSATTEAAGQSQITDLTQEVLSVDGPKAVVKTTSGATAPTNSDIDLTQTVPFKPASSGTTTISAYVATEGQSITVPAGTYTCTKHAYTQTTPSGVSQVQSWTSPTTGLVKSLSSTSVSAGGMNFTTNTVIELKTFN